MLLLGGPPVAYPLAVELCPADVFLATLKSPILVALESVANGNLSSLLVLPPLLYPCVVEL
jgi:hypothetical protein